MTQEQAFYIITTTDMSRISLLDALDIFNDQLLEIKQACEDNAREVISTYSPAGLTNLKSKEDVHKEVNRLRVVAKTKGYFTTINAINRRLTPTKTNHNSLTAEDIAKAKAYPIEQLVEIRRKTTRCLWHDDNNPSMHYYEKTNTLYCFVCQKSADTIEVVCKLDDCSFVDAVRKLN